MERASKRPRRKAQGMQPTAKLQLRRKDVDEDLSVTMIKVAETLPAVCVDNSGPVIEIWGSHPDVIYATWIVARHVLPTSGSREALRAQLRFAEQKIPIRLLRGDGNFAEGEREKRFTEDSFQAFCLPSQDVCPAFEEEHRQKVGSSAESSRIVSDHRNLLLIWGTKAERPRALYESLVPFVSEELNYVAPCVLEIRDGIVLVRRGDKLRRGDTACSYECLLLQRNNEDHWVTPEWKVCDVEDVEDVEAEENSGQAKTAVAALGITPDQVRMDEKVNNMHVKSASFHVH